jgi:PST family polysaccharide transporter
LDRNIGFAMSGGSEPGTPSAGRIVVINSVALYALYGTNFVLPLITLPYLLRTLGIAPFGAIAFCGAILQIVSIFTTFTFNLTATPLVATRPTERAFHGSLLTTVAIARGLMFVVATAGLAIATATIPSLRERWVLLAVQLPIAASEILFPSWLFLGVQRMVLVSALNAVSRVVTLIALFLLVHSPDDVAWAAGVQASHFVISGLLAQGVLLMVLGVRYGAPLRGQELRAFLADSWRMFVVTAAGNVYVRGATVILGFFAGDAMLGHFALVQRIGALLTGLVSPLSQAVFPHAARVWETDRAAYYRLQRRLLMVVVGVFVVGLLVLNLLASWMVEIIAGTPTPEAVELLRFFTPTILASAVSTLVTATVFATRKYSGLQWLFVGGAAIFIVTAPPLAYLWQAVGVSIAMLLVEVFMAGACLYYARRESAAATTSTPPS